MLTWELVQWVVILWLVWRVVGLMKRVREILLAIEGMAKALTALEKKN